MSFFNALSKVAAVAHNAIESTSALVRRMESQFPGIQKLVVTYDSNDPESRNRALYGAPHRGHGARQPLGVYAAEIAVDGGIEVKPAKSTAALIAELLIAPPTSTVVWHDKTAGKWQKWEKGFDGGWELVSTTLRYPE